LTGKNIRKIVSAAALLLIAALAVAAVIYLKGEHGGLSPLRFIGSLANLLGLCGLLGFVLMVALGTRFHWIERFLGLDRVYRIHKILGVAVVFMLVGHALLRTLFFSMSHGGKWAWSFLFYFSTNNVPLLIGHLAIYLLVLIVPLAIFGRHRISYWLWKNSHFLVYPAVAIGFVHGWLEQGKRFASVSNLAIFVPIALALIFLSAHRAVSALRLERRGVWQVADLVKETGDTTTLVLSRPEGPGPFAGRRAGQFAIIRVREGRRWSEPHPFTISAPPHSGELHFTIKAAGRFTSSVPSLTPGTEILCEGPYGVFSVDFREKRDVVMISGGVGITPFLSLIRHAVRVSAETSIVLFCCNRSLDDIIAMEELNLAAEQIPLSVVHVLSKQPKDGLPSGSERVRFESGHISGEILARHVPSADASFYLCGPPSLQETVLRALKETLGVPPSRVKRELFFY
jgi:predicted ferric reductase